MRKALVLVLLTSLAAGCGSPEPGATSPEMSAPQTRAPANPAPPATEAAQNANMADPIQPLAGAVVNTRLDRDADGVPDHLDGCSSTPAGVVVDAAGCRVRLSGEQRFRLDVGFATGAAAIVDMGGVENVLELLNRFPETGLIVEGHTDSQGMEAKNHTLSQHRAEAVAAILAETYGVAPKRITAQGLGESTPVADNNTLSGRAANRRVEIVVKPGV